MRGSTRDIEGEMRDVAGDSHFRELLTRSLYWLAAVLTSFSLDGGIDILEEAGRRRGLAGSS